MFPFTPAKWLVLKYAGIFIAHPLEDVGQCHSAHKNVYFLTQNIVTDINVEVVVRNICLVDIPCHYCQHCKRHIFNPCNYFGFV
jgi:hypothetical protein